MVESCFLYYITDRTAFAVDEGSRRRRLMEKILEAGRAGVDYIQLREKDLTTRELESLARDTCLALNQLRTENRELRTALLINSRTDVAMAVGADGVHLRSDDVPPQEVKEIWKWEAGTHFDKLRAGSVRQLTWREPRIGVSCHLPKEVAQAEANGATFAVFAPVFEKKDAPGSPAAGLALLSEACKANLPVFALGGISVENAKSCLEAGAAGIAAVRLFQENNVADTVRSLR